MDYVFEVAMMSDLISRSWMMEQLDGLGDTRLIKRNFIALVKNANTIDAVPVVRCRDCATPHNKYTGCPKLNGLVTTPDFYCTFGERKNGGPDG